MSEAIKFYTSDSNSGNESKSKGSKRNKVSNNPYANYNFNSSEEESLNNSNSNNSNSNNNNAKRNNTKGTVRANNENPPAAGAANTDYEDIEDVDYVRIDVEGDGSCLYRALYTTAFMYPIERDTIKSRLLPEFASVNSLLLTVLKAFGHPRDTLLPEENAVLFMRKQLSKGILGTHSDASVNEICNDAVSTFYNMVTGYICQSFNSDLSKEGKILINNSNNNNVVPSAYQIVIESMNTQISSFFTKTPVIQLTLKNFKELLAKTIVNTKTYASQLDAEIIRDILFKNNIIIKTASLNKFAKDQTFPIIEEQRPVLLVDNINEIHYNALVPKVEFDAYADTPFKGDRTLNSEVSREPNTVIEEVNKKGKKKTVRVRGEPIIFSKRTYNYRKAKGLAGGRRKTLKRKGRK